MLSEGSESVLGPIKESFAVSLVRRLVNWCGGGFSLRSVNSGQTNSQP